MSITFYKGYANEVKMTLTENRQPVNLANITKVAMVWSGGSVDSTLNSTEVEKGASDITLRLGLTTTLTVGEHDFKVVAFSGDHPQGIVFSEEKVTVK